MATCNDCEVMRNGHDKFLGGAGGQISIMYEFPVANFHFIQ